MVTMAIQVVVNVQQGGVPDRMRLRDFTGKWHEHSSVTTLTADAVPEDAILT